MVADAMRCAPSAAFPQKPWLLPILRDAVHVHPFYQAAFVKGWQCKTTLPQDIMQTMAGTQHLYVHAVPPPGFKSICPGRRGRGQAGGDTQAVVSMEQALPLRADWLNFNRFRARAEHTVPMGPYRLLLCGKGARRPRRFTCRPRPLACLLTVASISNSVAGAKGLYSTQVISLAAST